jgi:hypothetical protein
VEETLQQNGLAETRVDTVDPGDIRLLDLNARFMPHETFQRLVENVRKDGQLTQIPFGWLLHDDETQEIVLDDDGDPIYEVLSGNHRVKAAIAAELSEIKFEYVDHYLSPAQRAAIQLSHNELTGRDDPATLKVIYTEIDSVDWRLYSGLDDKKLELLEDTSPPSLSEANLTFQTVSVVFLPDELEEAKAIWDDVKGETAGSKERWVMRWQDYDAWLDAVEKASRAYGVKNVATGVMAVLHIFAEHTEDLRAGWLDEDGEPKHRGRVTYDLVFGDETLPSAVAKKLDKVVQRMLNDKKIDNTKRWQALESLADDFLNDRG